MPRRRRTECDSTPSASPLLRDRSPREDHVRLHPWRDRPGARAPQRQVQSGRVARDGRALSGGSRGGRRVHVHVVLARGCLRRRGDSLRAGPRVGHESDPGGKAKNDKLNSFKIATLLRGGLLPQAYVYPAAMRSTRDLLRRRLHLVRKRGQLLAHIQNTRAQYQLPEFGRRLAYLANRTGLSAHFPDPSVRKSIDVDLALLERYDELITDLELTIVREAKRHDGDAFHRLRSVPGIGKVLALTILYEIHDITRFDCVQEFASYARLVKCMHTAAGKVHGTGGAKMGNVHLKGPSPKPRYYFSATRRTARNCCRRSRRSTARAKHCRSWPTRSDGPCITCCREGPSFRRTSSSRRRSKGAGELDA
jgi:transposase